MNLALVVWGLIISAVGLFMTGVGWNWDKFHRQSTKNSTEIIAFVKGNDNVITKGDVVNLKNQSGGVTIGTFNDNRTFITAEKVDEINYEKLITRYPFGYIIFSIDHDKVRLIPGPMHISDEYEINWNNANVYKLTSEVIGINLPDVSYRQGGGCKNVGIEIHRITNIPQRSPIQWNGFAFDIMVELLQDNGSQLILVLGLAKKQ